MDEQDELVLLERVFLRLGSADTDEQLETTLAKFLCPVLLKLASQTEGVRKKVMELLVHVNKRVKSQTSIQLPVSGALAQYLDENVSPFVKNFTILYIKLGYPRLSHDNQVELLPQLVKCLVGKPEAQQNIILQLITFTLCHIKVPKTVTEQKESHWTALDASVQTLLLNYWMDIILLPYSLPSQAESSARTSGAATAAEASAAAASAAKKSAVPACFSEVTLKRVLGENSPTGDELEKIKMAVLQLVGSGLFPEHSIMCHLILGSADNRHSVAGLAELKLKQIVGPDDWNNSGVILKLYNLFLGTVLVKDQTCKEEMKKQPASVQQRLKIFPCLLKSREAANQIPSNIQVVFDCLFTANTNPRLKSQAVQFTCHMCQYCSDAKFAPLGPVLLSGLLKLIKLPAEDQKLKGLGYLAVAKVVVKMPTLLDKDISFIQSFFDTIPNEIPENRRLVQESLIMMSVSMTGLDSRILKQIEALVLQNIEEREVEARMAALHYAKTVFPSNHIPSRYALLLACGDSTESIHTEAAQVVHTLPEKSRSALLSGDKTKRTLMPSFTDMIMYIHEKATERLKGNVHKFVVGNAVLPFSPPSYIEMLMYLRYCLAYDSSDLTDAPPISDSLYLQYVDMQRQSASISKYVDRLLTDNAGESGPIGIYIGILRQLLSSLDGPPAMFCLLEIVAVARTKLSPTFQKHLGFIKGYMYSTQEEMCKFAAELYAIVTVDCLTENDMINVINEHLDKLKNKQSYEVQLGSLYCLRYLISKLVIKNSSSEQSMSNNLSQCVTSAVKRIIEYIDNSQVGLAVAACSAIGDIGRSGVLPLDGEKLCDDGSALPSKISKKSEAAVTVESVIKLLIEKVKSQKEQTKLREKAAESLGFLCVGNKDFAHRRMIIEQLVECTAPKQFELHVSIGSALVCAVMGRCNPIARDVWTVTEKEFVDSSGSCLDEQNEYISLLLSLLLEKYIRSSTAYIRQAACLWLWVLVRDCGQSAVVQSSIMNIQAALINLLGENDDVTQDVVSKGLGVVYEKCSEDQKKELVASLVDTLTLGKRKKIEVTSDTAVFQEGALGKTPDGQGMSTYRELCSIANDLNQPDLIYKFMNLANHNAAWNAKRGAAYGFSVIAQQAGDQLAPHLDKIVPKLYRYQFDPNTRVQQAMTAIWDAIVQDSNKTINKYLHAIVDDLIKNMTSNQWRVRESSCLALNDLLRGRPLDDIVDQLPTLWETCFRVRDDIKESSRNAADTAMKTLSRCCIKLCNPAQGQTGVKATSLVLSALLQHGLASSVAEVRAISLTTIMKIGQGAGTLVKPHIPVLAAALLESITTLEPQMLNYLSLHAAANQDAQEKLDSARMAAYKTSPMMETLNLCIPHIDEDVLKELMPRLIEIIGKGVGLGTKVCCANFIISITRSRSQDIQPYTGKLLGSLMHGMSDRNIAVRKSYASTIGHVVRVSKDSSVERVLERVKQWYLEKEDESLKEAGATVVQAINQHSPDVIKSHATDILPLIFLAMHDKSEDVQNADQSDKQLYRVWEDVWTEVTPGTEAGVRLYLKEIVELSHSALGSQSWALKRQAALAMKTVADKQGSNISNAQLDILVKALLTGLTGRTWSGKEALLKALSTVCSSCRSVLQQSQNGSSETSNETSSEQQQQQLDEIVSAAVRECRKDNIQYKMEALRCTADILVAFDMDRYKEIADIVYPILKKKEEEADDDDMNSSTKQELLTCAYETLGCCWPDNPDTQRFAQEEMAELIKAGLGKNTWKVEVALLRAVKRILNKLHAVENSQAIDNNLTFLSSFFSAILTSICSSLGNIKSSSLRSEALNVVQIIVTKLEALERLSVLSHDEWRQLVNALDNTSKSDSQPELKDKATLILSKLNKYITST